MLIKNARNSKSGREIKDVNSQINIFLRGPTLVNWDQDLCTQEAIDKVLRFSIRQRNIGNQLK